MSTHVYRGRPLEGQGAPVWWFGRFVRATIGTIVSAAFRTTLAHPERIPSTGAILAGNHVSYLDPVLMWCVAPRPIHFMAKRELWRVRWLGWLLDRFWAFPVDRSGADKEAISTGTRLLEAGDLLGVFPEGTRKRHDGDELGEAHGGAAFMALRAGVPIVPVAFVGTEDAWPAGRRFPRFVRVEVRIGQPVYPEAFEGTRRERVAAMTDQVMRMITELRNENGAQ